MVVDGVNGFLCPSSGTDDVIARAALERVKAVLSDPSGCREVRRRATEMAKDSTWNQVAASLGEFLNQATQAGGAYIFTLRVHAVVTLEDGTKCPGKIERKKFVPDAESAGQQIAHQKAEQEQASERKSLLQNFVKLFPSLESSAAGRRTCNAEWLFWKLKGLKNKVARSPIGQIRLALMLNWKSTVIA